MTIRRSKLTGQLPVSRFYATDEAMMNGMRVALIPVLLSCCRQAIPQAAQTPPSGEKEAIAILELGAAGSRSFRQGGSGFGPTIAAEVTPVENWLELEAGVTPLFGSGSTEWDIDLLFKKPWTLSRKVEFMAGVGPEWVHTNGRNADSNSISGEAALDFMFWPAKERRFGWYLEPACDYNFGQGHDRSAGVSGGLLIAIR